MVDDPEKDSMFITWANSKADVQKVELVFKELTADRNAQIADLEINYCTQQ